MQRIEAIIAHESFEAYMKLNEKTEIGREFCCHQLQHALDVARIYYILYLEWEKDKMAGEFENINSRQAKELIYAIGLLHDIGRGKNTWMIIWIMPKKERLWQNRYSKMPVLIL